MVWPPLAGDHLATKSVAQNRTRHTSFNGNLDEATFEPSISLRLDGPTEEVATDVARDATQWRRPNLITTNDGLTTPTNREQGKASNNRQSANKSEHSSMFQLN